MNRERAVSVHRGVRCAENAIHAPHAAIRAVNGDGPGRTVLGRLAGGGVACVGGQMSIVIDRDRVLVREQSPRPGADDWRHQRPAGTRGAGVTQHDARSHSRIARLSQATRGRRLRTQSWRPQRHRPRTSGWRSPAIRWRRWSATWPPARRQPPVRRSSRKPAGNAPGSADSPPGSRETPRAASRRPGRTGAPTSRGRRRSESSAWPWLKASAAARV